MMDEKKSKILRGQIPTSVFYILFGLCLALMPVETVNVLCKVVFGLVLIGAGVYHILIFVLEKDNSTIFGSFFRCDRVGDRYLFVYESNCGCETADSYAGSFLFLVGQHLDDARQYEIEEARAGCLDGISG